LVQLVRGLTTNDSKQFDHYFIPIAFQKLRSAYHPSRNPKDEDINSTILSLLNGAKETYIVVDALDESSSPQEVVSFLESLCQHALTSVHVLITSRQEEDIELAVGDLSIENRIVPFEIVRVNDDIRHHLQECVSREPYKRWKSALKEKVVDHLSEHANGVFRWADLQIVELGKKGREKDVDRALKRLPRTLEETYERILKQIDEDYMEEALAILRWLAYSCQPLSLEQAAEIAAFERIKRPSSLDREDYSVSFSPDNRFDSASWVRRILSGLVVVTGLDNLPSSADSVDELSREDQERIMNFRFYLNKVDHIPGDKLGRTILFAHFSVKEYLESTTVCPIHFQLDATSGQWYIFKSSLAYLHYYDSEYSRGTNSDILPLLSYAWLNWAYHANACLEDIGQDEIESLLRKLSDVSGNAFLLSASAVLFRLPLYLKRRSLENFFVDQALVSVLRKFLEGSKFEKYFEFAYTPFYTENATDLWTASYEGREEHVRLLLVGGFDVNSTLHNSLGKSKHTRRGWTPLHSAAEGGNESVIWLLLMRGAEIDAEFIVSDSLNRRYSIDALARRFRHEEVAQLLVERRSGEKQRMRHSGITPTAVAAAAGHQQVVRQLLDLGADPNREG
jgi:hypothetical protein